MPVGARPDRTLDAMDPSDTSHPPDGSPREASDDAALTLLRHYLAALAFRARHVTDGAPAGFGDFRAGAGVRTPAEIVRHVSGMMRFVRDQFQPPATPAVPSAPLEALPWEAELERLRATLRALDRALTASGGRPHGELTLGQLLQGQLADAMTHVGQLATLRRLAGAPVERVRYWQVQLPPLDDA